MAQHKPITEPLREAASEVDSIRQLAREAGMNHVTVLRFIEGRVVHSDGLDRLAAVLGYELKPIKQK